MEYIALLDGTICSFFPIFSYIQTRGGSYHHSYKLGKERVSLTPIYTFAFRLTPSDLLKEQWRFLLPEGSNITRPWFFGHFNKITHPSWVQTAKNYLTFWPFSILVAVILNIWPLSKWVLFSLSCICEWDRLLRFLLSTRVCLSFYMYVWHSVT